MMRQTQLLLCTLLAATTANGMFIPHFLFNSKHDPSPQEFCLLSKFMDGTALMADVKCCDGHVTELDVACPSEPGNENYTFADLNTRTPESCDEFNLVPTSVMMVRSQSDVQKSLLFARLFKKEVRVRSGGHSQRCMSSCENCIIIDFFRMREITNFTSEGDEPTVYMTVEPGNTLQDLFFHYIQMDTWLPHGQESTVGIGGHFGGGGMGQATRPYGLSADYIVGVDIVLSCGRKMTVLDTDHELAITGSKVHNLWNKWRQDLLWAVRGNGHLNFGIITKYYVRTVERPQYRVVGVVDYALTSTAVADQFWGTMCGYYNGQTDNTRLTMWPLLAPSQTTGQPVLSFLVFYIPENSSVPEEAMLEAAPVIEAFLSLMPAEMVPVQKAYQPVPHAYAFGEQMYQTPAEIGRTTYQCSSRYVERPEDVCDKPEYLAAFSDLLFNDTTADFFSLGHTPFTYFEPMGGRMQTMDPHMKKSSFGGRNMWGTLQSCRFPIPGVSVPKEAMTPFVDRYNNTITAPAGDSVYVNYQDEYTTELSHLYPSTSAYKKLQRIKRKYDKLNYFKFPLSIEPAQGWF